MKIIKTKNSLKNPLWLLFYIWGFGFFKYFLFYWLKKKRKLIIRWIQKIREDASTPYIFVTFFYKETHNTNPIHNSYICSRNISFTGISNLSGKHRGPRRGKKRKPHNRSGVQLWRNCSNFLLFFSNSWDKLATLKTYTVIMYDIPKTIRSLIFIHIDKPCLQQEDSSIFLFKVRDNNFVLSYLIRSDKSNPPYFFSLKNIYFFK